MLLLRRRSGEVTALSMPNGAADPSFMGESSADEGAVVDTLYLGVKASDVCGWFMYSKSSVGKV